MSDTDMDGPTDTDNETSTISSVMDLTDLLTMAMSNTASEITDSIPKLDLPSGQDSLTAGRTTGVSFDEKINYSKRMEERIGSLLDTKILSDVKFLVGEAKKEIEAHKLILALSSPVFTSMFYSTLLESQDAIEIPDCKPEAFQALVEFIYKGECEAFSKSMNLDLGLAVLYTARKYAVKGLEDICLVVLSSLITIETVFDISHAANLHSLPTLETECWEFIEDHTELVLKCHLENMELDMLILLLKNERLNIREAKLFELTYTWIERTLELLNLQATKENKLKVGGGALELIRYPIMCSTEFADLVVPTGILTTDQIARIFTFISTSPERRERYPMPMEFATKERTPRVFKRNRKKSKGGTLKLPNLVAFALDRNGNSDRSIPPVVASSEEQPQEWQERSARRSRRSRRRNR